MKTKIEQKELLRLISQTQNIVEKRNTMAVLVNILLEADGDHLSVFATDLEVSLTDRVNAIVEQSGKVAVNAKMLYEITKELDEGEITLTKKENNWLEIRQHRSVSNIVGISAEEYPIFPTNQGEDFLKLPAFVLSEMIEKTVYSVSNDETRYHLNGVFFEKQSSANEIRYRMVATDGHRLSLVERKADEKIINSFKQGVIIPRKGLHEIRKLIDNIDGDIELAVEGSQIIVRYGTTILMVRLIEGKYPNYQQLIPQNLTKHLLLKRNSLLSSVRRVSLLSNQKSKGVTLALSPGKLEISSSNPDLGDAKEEIEVMYKGDPLRIGFNAKYIMDILTSFDDEEIDMELTDQLSPGLVRPHNDLSYTCVIMPMRI